MNQPMSQSESDPLSQVGKMNAALPQVARNDFDASDDQYFAGNSRLVRLRTPLPHERTSQVQSIEMISMLPMLVVMRQSPESAARPIALVALNKDDEESIIGSLGTMGDGKILEILNGVQMSALRPKPKWWPL